MSKKRDSAYARYRAGEPMILRDPRIGERDGRMLYLAYQIASLHNDRVTVGFNDLKATERQTWIRLARDIDFEASDDLKGKFETGSET
jgi:hypothetical protein